MHSPQVSLQACCYQIPAAMTEHTDTRKNLKTVHFPPFIFFLEAPAEPPSPIGGYTWAVGLVDYLPHTDSLMLRSGKT